MEFEQIETLKEESLSRFSPVNDIHIDENGNWIVDSKFKSRQLHMKIILQSGIAQQKHFLLFRICLIRL